MAKSTVAYDPDDYRDLGHGGEVTSFSDRDLLSTMDRFTPPISFKKVDLTKHEASEPMRESPLTRPIAECVTPEVRRGRAWNWD